MPAPVNESYQYSNTAKTTQTLTFTAATAGNLLVAFVGHDKNATGASVTSGWTLVDFENASTQTSGALAYKIAAGGETSVTFTVTTSRKWVGWVGEFAGLGAVEVAASANSGATSVTSQTSGTTSTTTTATATALAFFSSDSKGNTDAGISFTNSFTLESTDPGGIDTGNAGVYVARKELTTTGTQETTFSSTGSGDQMIGMIAVFPATSSGVTGTASITEGADTVSASGTVQTVITGTATITEGADTASAAGNVVITGSAAFTEGQDTVSASGTVTGGGVAGSASFTEGADTANASGTVQQVITGTASQVEAADTIAASGNVVIIGSASITEGQDTIAASGSAASPITGTVSITEEADTITATDRQHLSIIGNYEVNGVEKTIKNVGSLLEVIEAAADKAAARVAIGQFMTEHDINPQTYVFSSLELKALAGKN